MARYRLYFINPKPRHIRDVAEFDATSDEHAIRHARKRCDGRAMELWRGDQVIYCHAPAED